MTDDNKFDQEEMHSAFERLNQRDALQPSVELDAMILQMAAEEVVEETGQSKVDNHNTSNVTDISFSRGRRESHKALKKKGIFPAWLMPMGLAATVLLSFGVVNRVLMSPEFDSLAKSSSYEAVSDENILNEQPITDSFDTRDLDAADKFTDDESLLSESSTAKDKSLVLPTPAKPPVSAEEARPAQKVNPELTDIVAASPSTDALRYDAKEKSQSETHLGFNVSEEPRLAARLKRERLEQSEKKKRRVENLGASQLTEPEVNIQTEPVTPVAESRAAVSQTRSRQASSLEAEEFADMEFQSEPSPPILSEAPEALGAELDEVVVTDTRQNTFNKQDFLTDVLFEHKQCQVPQDCALLALECDSCACLETVNNEYYQEYQSEFSKSEIAEQCTRVSVECLRNYCQVQQAE